MPEYHIHNNIIYERCDLFKDFITDLINLMFDTFLGDDIMDQKNKKEHFNWCWNKTVESFRKTKIHFKDECDLKEYIWNVTNNMFYSIKTKDKTEDLRNNIILMFSFIFDYTITKKEYDFNIMLQTYNRFNGCLELSK